MLNGCLLYTSAENVAQQLEKRISFRRAMKQSIGNAMRRGAKGIKIMCSGRLGGAEIMTEAGKSEKVAVELPIPL